MPELTQSVIADYLKDPFYCPHCKSYNITAYKEGHVTAYIEGLVSETEMYKKCTCIDCSKSWTEIYTLTKIEEST